MGEQGNLSEKTFGWLGGDVIWTEELAWWLGVLYGDGHSSNKKQRKSISVTCGDKDLVDKWVALVGKGVVKKRNNSNCWISQIAHCQITEWLASAYGIDGAKSSTLVYPVDLPDMYAASFIRGLWDTDGTVDWHKRAKDRGRSDQLRLSYHSKSKDFSHAVAAKIKTLADIDINVDTRLKKSGKYAGYEGTTCSIAGREAEKLFLWIYEKADSSICMDRKKNIGFSFLKYIAENTKHCLRCGIEVRCREYCKACVKTRWEGQNCSCGNTPVIAKGLCRRCYQRQWKDDSRSWTSDTKTLDWLNSLDSKQIRELPKQELNAIEEELFVVFRKKGFPVDVLKSDIGRENWETIVDQVRNSSITLNNSIIERVGNKGQSVCRSMFVHRFEASNRSSKSVVKAFEDDKTLKKAITRQIKDGDRLDPKGIVRQLAALCTSPRNFPPVLARFLIDRYTEKGDLVYDPCLGYGGRLLGCLSSKNECFYIGQDVDPRAVKAANSLSSKLDLINRASNRPLAVEDWNPTTSAKLIITSPPYFDRENYGPQSEQALKQYKTPQEWVEGFLSSLINKSYKTSEYFVLNIADITWKGRKIELVQQSLDLAIAAGFEVHESFDWKLASFRKTGDRFEKIWVFRKK